MSIWITAPADGGNIEVIDAGDPADIRLNIRKDNQSDFYQWFYFRVSGAKGRDLTLVIENAGQSAYAAGWNGYRARVSDDRETWVQAETSYGDGRLVIHHRPATNACYFAYFAPYTLERHDDLVSSYAALEGVKHEVLGLTLDGHPLDVLTFESSAGTPRSIWLYARQHPGETMAEWWMEGALMRLADTTDPLTRELRSKAAFHVVPNMNPDGSRRGHLRTNAVGVNLNRVWDAPTLENSPEVYHVLKRMDETGVDLALDVHGDEEIPHNFIAGFDGIPSLTERQTRLLRDYTTALKRITPDFQTKVGYPPAPAGEANLSMSTNALAERFGCLAMTLEMPFKDANDNPDAIHGWSPERCRKLGRDCLEAIADVIDSLR